MEEKWEALEKSIEHWERLTNGTSADKETITSKDCALCKLYIYNDGCAGCPVAEAGFVGCKGSPFYDVYEMEQTLGWGYKDDPEFRALCRVELDFLKSLRK
jgi:hypothetical protein